MSSSTVNTILTAGITAISDNFSRILPVILPVAVALAVLFGVLHWIYGSSRRK